MNRIKARALAQFPSVLLTLISIIQALALELLWSKIDGSEFLWSSGESALIGWGMITVCFMGILVIWLVFTTMVMGLVWEPMLRDSIAPFAIGLQEFMLISLVEETFNPYWLLVLASVFVTTNWITHLSMKRARAQAENALFFEGISPAKLRDFLPAIAIVAGFSVLAAVMLAFPGQRLLTYLALLVANGILVAQMIGTRRLWQRAMNLPADPEVSRDT